MQFRSGDVQVFPPLPTIMGNLLSIPSDNCLMFVSSGIDSLRTAW